MFKGSKVIKRVAAFVMSASVLACNTYTVSADELVVVNEESTFTPENEVIIDKSSVGSVITDNDEVIMEEIPEVSEQASDEDILIEDADQEDTAVEEVTIEESELNTVSEFNNSDAWDGITTEKTYEQDSINYVFILKKSWRGGYNASVRIYNNGDDTIENWALSMNYPVDITNLWNATIEDNAEGKYTIKNAAWNSDIKPGRSVEYGFTVKGDFERFPEGFEMLGVKSEQDKQGYTVEYFVDNEWKSGFTGRIVITNTSDSPIEDWTLSFTYDREIRSIWSATIESHEGNRYVIKNKSYNANIKPGESVSFGFNGKGGTSDNEPTEYMLESISFNTIVVSEEENDTPSFDEKIEEVMSRYDESNYDLDTDNDGMKDCEEEIIGTDLNAEDTDGDSLTDHEEVYMTWTDPLIADSVISGISDAEADSDNDGIINKEEIKLGMDPRSSDTDEDGLSDHDEINVYGTDPILIDTDKDGIEDAHEIMLGFDPLKKDTDNDGIEDGDVLFAQEIETEFEGNEYIEKVKVTAQATNLFPEVTLISENPRCLNEDFEEVGVFGTPIEIYTESDIESARISFYLKDGYDAKEYIVLWLDEENSRFVECDTEYDEVNGIVSANTDHFSTYFLASSQKWNNKLAELGKVPQGNFETMIVFDFSKSMGISDATYADFTYGLSTSKRRIDLGKAFFGRASASNRQGVVFFNNNGSVVARLGSTDSELYNTLKILENYSDGYNTNIATALTVALDELKTSENKNAVKSIVLISDGGTECEGDVLSYDRAVLERAKRENVRIHTVALGDNAVMDNLREIADVTGGTSFVYAFHNASYIADKVFSLPQIYGYIDVTPTVHIQEKDILGSEAYLKNLRKRSFVELSYVINYSYNILCGRKVAMMMEDYYNYSMYSDPNKISDKMWDAYCNEFNKSVRGFSVVTKDIHYFRNKLNRAPSTRDELLAEKEKWTLLEIGDSLYHMYGDDDALFNIKFNSNDGEGKYEGVYNREGTLLTEENDPVNMGTYNYYGPVRNRILHGYFDVVPYNVWGNIKGTLGRIKPRNENDFYSNFEAQAAYNRINAIMNAQ